MKKILIVINPSSGNQEAKNYAEQLESRLLTSGKEILLYETTEQTDALDIQQMILEIGADTLIAFGGDGTINMCANAIMEVDQAVSLGVVPVGTMNNFARMIGMSTDPKKAVQQLEQAATKKVDIGLAGNQYFISSFSVGPIPETVQHVDVETKERFGPLAYLIEGAKMLNDEHTYSFVLKADEKVVEKEYGLLLVTMSDTVLGIESFLPQAAADDGKLEFFGLKKTSLGEKAGLMLKVLKRETDQSDYVDVTKCNELSIRFKESEGVYATIDGDKGPGFPVTLKVLPQALTILVPGEE